MCMSQLFPPVTMRLAKDLAGSKSLRDARKIIQDAQMLIMSKLYVTRKNFLNFVEAALTNICECCHIITKGIHLIGVCEDTLRLDPGRPSSDLVEFYTKLQKITSNFNVSSRVVESMLMASIGTVE
eukprot:gnl/Chilomastix_caulleri/4943.p1 GENE.gnl/Chilomastix_caulleri/4943~~gnl/Chilomastix_caulleri/4943.p1  ORF type:complete len:126 (+),score=7.42 gnl/Chilomastix_caulleri/4943:1-378(+)